MIRSSRLVSSLLTLLSISVNSPDAPSDKHGDASTMSSYHRGGHRRTTGKALQNHRRVFEPSLVEKSDSEISVACVSASHLAEHVGQIPTGHLHRALAPSEVVQLLRSEANADLALDHPHRGWAGSFFSHDGFHLFCSAARKNTKDTASGSASVQCRACRHGLVDHTDLGLNQQPSYDFTWAPAETNTLVGLVW